MARILFIGIDFYDYAARISAAFERLGHTVDFYAIEDRGFASKSAKKLAFSAYEKRRAAYHSRLIEKSGGRSYDVVLFIQVHQMRHAALERLRALHPDARFVLYNWDSLTTHDFRPWMRHFDHVATFDPDDARAIGIAYLPLFAIPRFFDIDPARPIEQDLYFVGAIGSMNRFDALARLHGFCEGAGLTTKLHLVCSPVVRLQLWRAGKSLPGVTGRSLDFEGVVAMLEGSRATFDFANHRQSGYTMRLIENMCAGRKIITENPRILDEPFYREDRFLLVDGHDFSAIPEFLATPITSKLDVEAFHVDNWARRLIADRQDAR
ncbi:MAG: hypothetical protein QNI87_07740 [Erythrobacter sp.]|uniref:hypothetical protein n=1 Tax=Erythrobacter sp. TaxID=1042 RepID=UPI00262C7BAB|nr:hypothetical protein [Erythrobacter sp.]MDJ0978413.1 hypothetical protein [Erythrobacter sp.]